MTQKHVITRSFADVLALRATQGNRGLSEAKTVCEALRASLSAPDWRFFRTKLVQAKSRLAKSSPKGKAKRKSKHSARKSSARKVLLAREHTDSPPKVVSTALQRDAYRKAQARKINWASKKGWAEDSEADFFAWAAKQPWNWDTVAVTR